MPDLRSSSCCKGSLSPTDGRRAQKRKLGCLHDFRRIVDHFIDLFERKCGGSGQNNADKQC